MSSGHVPGLIIRVGDVMIKLTRLNGKVFVVNAELIEIMEETPDTVVTLNNGNRFVVSESVDEVVDRIVKYRKKINHIVIHSDDEKSGV